AKMDSKGKEEKDQDESEILDEKDLVDLYRKRENLIPEFKCVWFQFHTDALYCNVSSLAILKDGMEYGIPFGIAKIVLRSHDSLIQFLNNCQLNDDGSIKYNYMVIEDLKNRQIEPDQDFENDVISIKGKKLSIE